MMPSRLLLVLLALACTAACAADKPASGTSATTVRVPLLTYSTKSDEARREVSEGERLSDLGYAFQANEAFKRAVAADTSFGYAYLRVAQTGFSADNYATNVRRAVAHLATANAIEKLLIQAEQKNDENDLAAGAALLAQAAELEPRNARLWINLGAQYFNMQKAAEVRAAFERSIAADSAYGQAWLFLGNTYVFLEPRDLVKAEHYMLEGQRLWPNTPATFTQLGALRRAQGRFGDAIAAYTRLIALDPNESAGYQFRGNANVFSGHFDAARADYDEAFRLSRPTERVPNGTEGSYLEAYRGNVDGTLKALAEFRGALKGLKTANPEQDDYQLLQNILEIALITGRLSLADSTLEVSAPLLTSLAQKSGSHGFVKFAAGQNPSYAGILAAERGDLATARAKVAEIERARQGDSDPSQAGQLHSVLGMIAMQEKNYTKADAEFRAADASGNGMHLIYFRALAAEGRGDKATEKELLQRIATYNFNTAQYAAVRYAAIQKLKALE